MSVAALVREFHEKFGLTVRDQPTLIAGEELEFRKTLIREETEELFEALDAGDLQHAYKELSDLLYVVYGLDMHLGQKLDEAVAETHRSNMTKLWDCDLCDGAGNKQIPCMVPENGSMEDALGAIVMRCMRCCGEGRYVKYREDGKVLKPPTYSPADLSKIIPKED